MSHTVKLTISDALYAATVDKAKADGQAFGNQTGAQYIIRKAIRIYLNQNGYKKKHLDLSDDEYRERKRKRGTGAQEPLSPSNHANGANQ